MVVETVEVTPRGSPESVHELAPSVPAPGGSRPPSWVGTAQPIAPRKRRWLGARDRTCQESVMEPVSGRPLVVDDIVRVSPVRFQVDGTTISRVSLLAIGATGLLQVAPAAPAP